MIKQAPAGIQRGLCLVGHCVTARPLQLYLHGLAVVVHGLLRGGGRLEGVAVGGVDDDDAEGPGIGHVGVRAVAVAEGERVLGVVPMDLDLGVGAVLVVIGCARVVVEREAGVGTGVDA